VGHISKSPGTWIRRSARAPAPVSTRWSRPRRVNGVAPLAYFEHLYEHLPLANTVAELEALLPWNVKPLLKSGRPLHDLTLHPSASRLAQTFCVYKHVLPGSLTEDRSLATALIPL
jgi:hypothetical protein